MLTAAELWRDTRAVVARHRGALLTLAAAAVFLPNAALRLLAPPVVAPGLDAAHPPVLPGGLWLALVAIILLQFAGLFAIAAITADPHEGGDRPLGTTLKAAVPALGRFLLALLLFAGVYILATIVLGLVLAVVLAIASVASPNIMAGAAKGQPPVALMLLVAACCVPLLLWLWARLSPLVGVYLREPVGVTAGIRRAWALSGRAAAPLVVLIVAYTVVTLATSAMQATSDTGGIAAILVSLFSSALGTIAFVYGAAGTGIVYRRLAAL